MAPTESTRVGAVLSGRFRLTREIGRGGMGIVYAADPVSGGPTVAIKVLHPSFVAEDAVRARFLAEGRSSTELTHPNIVHVHECIAAEDGTPYFVMDLLEGVPLAAHTKEGTRVGLGHAIRILQGVLAGLEGAHARDGVHRNLKPSNVFLAGRGEAFQVKLLDFGLARVMDAAGGMGTKTRTGALLGTPAYMSPEQVKGAKDVDARSDLWSTGVMFYEMLSGRVAFAAPTEYARLAAVISAQPPAIEGVDPDLAVVAPFLQRALEKDRDRRFQSAREMVEAALVLMPVPSLTAPESEREQDVPTRSVPSASVPIAARRSSRDRSPWSLVTDNAPPPGEEDQVPSTLAPRAVKDVLTAAVRSGHSSTLASPNRAPSTAPPPPAPVVILAADEPLPARPVAADPSMTASSPTMGRGMASPLVAMLVTVALALGFSLGVLYGRSH